MIRKPNYNEMTACLELLYMSAPKMFHYLFARKEDNFYKTTRQFYAKPDNMFSKDYMLVKSENNNVCGLLLSYPVKDEKRLVKNTVSDLGVWLTSVGLIDMLKIVHSSRLAKYLQVFKDDEYYISNLAVFETFRGRGLGLELLREAERLAVSQGYSKLSLAVEFYNKKAKSIYEHFGFKQVAKVEFPENYHKYDIDGFYKMVKPLKGA